jgi:hypothetical protein
MHGEFKLYSKQYGDDFYVKENTSMGSKSNTIKQPGLAQQLNYLLYRYITPPLWSARLRSGLIRDSKSDRLPSAGKDGLLFAPGSGTGEYLRLLETLHPRDRIVAEADDVLRHRFDLLGSGPSELPDPIPWHTDFKSGRTWPLIPRSKITRIYPDDLSDVKVPWELSRFYFLIWLGKAHLLTGDSVYADKALKLVDNWIDTNPPGYGVNWVVPMEVAIRAINWIASYGFFTGSTLWTESLRQKIHTSLFMHGDFIRNHLEYSRRLGNHFLSNAVGLIVIGAFFAHTPKGKRWFRFGSRLLERQMDIQVTPDGVDYEKSNSYHRFVLELFIAGYITGKRAGYSFRKGFEDRLHAMFRFVEAYIKPNGQSPNIGDADDGRVIRFRAEEDLNDHRYLLSLGTVLFGDEMLKATSGEFSEAALWLTGIEGYNSFSSVVPAGSKATFRYFREGGYIIVRNDNIYFIMDVGDLGIQGKGGHGHNDTFSFELQIQGEDIIVDPGTYCYTMDPRERQKFRSSAFHNTVVVDGEEIADFQHLWYVRKDTTHPVVTRAEHTGTSVVIEAYHSGYTRLSGSPVHTRFVSIDTVTRDITITDTVSGTGEHTCEAFLHLAPDLNINGSGENTYEVSHRGIRGRIALEGGKSDIISSWYSPGYGRRTPAACIRTRAEGRLPITIRTKFQFLGDGIAG